MNFLTAVIHCHSCSLRSIQKMAEKVQELQSSGNNSLVMLSSLIEKFNTATLPKSEWTHHAHITVALWYVHTYEFDDAVCRLKSGIILLNNFHGTENTDRSGYHETLTIFWAKIISIYVALHPSVKPEELADTLLNSVLAEKELPFRFYSKREMLTSAYRAVYHEPTLQKLDEDAIRVTLNS